MRNKKVSNSTMGIELELENLKEQNHKLKDSLMLQRTALQHERRQKEEYILKYHQLEKEKKEAIERYQNLMLKLIQNNILCDDNPMSKLFTQPSAPKVPAFSKEGKDIDPKSSRFRTNISQQDTIQQNHMLSRLLQYNVQTINQKQKSLEKTRQKLLELKLEPGKLITLREVNGASVQYKQSKERLVRKPSGSESQRRLSYFEKLKFGKQ